jgi:HEAT repeat protein
MNQLLQWLSGGDLRSDGMSNEVADIVLENPDLFDELLEGLSESDDVIRGRSADALEKVSRYRPDLLADRVSELIVVARNDTVAMVKMHVAMILGHLADHEEKVEEMTCALLDLLQDESVFVRSWAIVSLCLVGRIYPNRRNKIVNEISRLRKDSSIAIRSKVQKAVNLLVNENVSFPKGWIKRGHLKGLVDKG